MTHALHDILVRVVVEKYVHHDVLVVALGLVVLVTLHHDTVVVRLVLDHLEKNPVMGRINWYARETSETS